MSCATEELWYKLLCYYHAKTELYDRTLTNLRSPYDSTEAYIVEPHVRKLSNQYSHRCRKMIEFIANCESIPFDMRRYSQYKNYSAQMYINEYERMNKLGEYKQFENIFKQNEEECEITQEEYYQSSWNWEDLLF